MEIFQTIWTALSTPNPTLIQIISIPFVFIEITVSTLLFTTILKLNTNKHQITKYTLLVSIISIISNNFITKPFGPVLHMILTPLLIMLFFKTSFLKSLVAELLPVIVIVLLETILGKLYYMFLSLPYDLLASIPIYRFSIVSLIYAFIYLIYKVLKNFNFSLNFSFPLDNLNKRSKSLLILTLVCALISIGMQIYLIIFYINNLPLPITIFSTLILIIYFLISIYTIIKTSTLATISQDLEQTKLYNNTLQILHDNMRAFKHDFANIVQSIGRIY